MIVLQTIAVAFAMFSAVPVPQFAWNEKNMRYALCAFPLVGLLCGALWCVCGVLPLPAPARAAGFCLVPVWVTGGIHLDGYADTCDALASYGDREKKLEILKDPHCGAFAVIRLCSYFAAYLCLAACVQFTPPGGRSVDAGAGAGAGTFRSCGGSLSHGQKHRPCPYLCLCCRPHRCAQCAGGAGGAALRCAAGFRRRGTGRCCNFAVFVVSPCSRATAGRHYRRFSRVVFAKN